jgi:hypothetical protein
LFSATVLLRKNSTSQFLTTGPGKDGEASESGDGFPRFLAAPKDRHHTEKTVRSLILGLIRRYFPSPISHKAPSKKVGSDQILAGLQMSLG